MINMFTYESTLTSNHSIHVVVVVVVVVVCLLEYTLYVVTPRDAMDVKNETVFVQERERD